MEYGEAVRVLRGIPLFATLDPAKLKLLAFASDYQTVEDGEALFQAGDPADSVYLIDQGEAEVVVTQDDHEIRVAVLTRHEMFGEMAIFRASPRTATVRAKGRLGVLRIDGKMFLQMVTENPATALGVMRALSDKLMRAMESYEEMEARVRMLQALEEPSPDRP